MKVYLSYLLILLFILFPITTYSDTCDDIVNVGDTGIEYNSTAANGNTCTEYTVGADTFCGCTVTEASGVSYVATYDPGAPLLVNYTYVSDTDHIGLGYWMPTSEVQRNFCAGGLQYSNDLLHTRNFDVYDVSTNPDGYADITPIYTPDGQYVYVSDAINSMASISDVRYSVYKAPIAGDLGWKSVNFLNSFTSNYVFPSYESEDIRHIYATSLGFYEIELDLSLTDVGGTNVIKLNKITELARRPELGGQEGRFKDFYTINKFTTDSNKWQLGYSVLIEDTTDILGPTKVVIMDHSQCRELKDGDTYACKTIELYSFDWAGLACGVPRNTAISSDGKFIAFVKQYETYAGASCNLWKFENSPVYVLKNPFEYTDLMDSCDMSGNNDGYNEPIDCTVHLKTASVYDLDTKCPNYNCCSGTANCGYCTSLGERENVCSANVELNVDRDSLSFIEQDNAQYLSVREYAFSNDPSGMDEYISTWELSLATDTATGEFVAGTNYPKRVQVVDYNEDESEYMSTYDDIGISPQFYLGDMTSNPDRDGIEAAYDTCPCHYDPSQLDSDDDGIGNACDYSFSSINRCDLPKISNITPTGQAETESITISGKEFGDEGYVTFNGFKSTATSWSSTSITVTIPNGAVSGPVRVTDSNGKVSNSYTYDIDYSAEYTGDLENFYPTDEDEFGIIDSGGIGSAMQIQVDDNSHVFTGSDQSIQCWQENETEPIFTLLDYDTILPSKLAKLEQFGNYLFTTGDFGLMIFDKDDVCDPDISAYPVAWWGKDTFHGFDIKTYTGVPITGTLISLLQFYDASASPEIYFLQWDADTETLELLSTYDGAAFNVSRYCQFGVLPLLKKVKTLFEVALDYYWAKMYVGGCSDGQAVPTCCYLYEFDISDIDNISYTDNTIIGDTLRASVPQSVVTHKDKLYTFMAVTNVGAKSFHRWDTHELTAFDNYYYTRSCSVDESNPSCAVDADCSGLGWVGCGSGAVTCECINNMCSYCTIDALSGELDVLPEQDLMYALPGTSTDQSYRHNIYLWDYDTTDANNMAGVSSESMNFGMDITLRATGEDTGYIYVADEWISIQRMAYDKSTMTITHHDEPSWDHAARVSNQGWFVGNPVEIDGRWYLPEHQLRTINSDNLGDVSNWRLLLSGMTFSSGAKRGNYILAKGQVENFHVTADGVRFYVVEEDPVTLELSEVGDPVNDALHYERETGIPVHEGEIYWLEPYVAYTPTAEFIRALLVDPSTGDVTSLATYEMDSNANTHEQALHLYLYDSDTFLAPIYINIGDLGAGPEDYWGGLDFIDFSYPSGVPDLDNPARPITMTESNNVHILQGWSVLFGGSPVGSNNMITLIIADISSVLMAEVINDAHVLVFDLDDLSTDNTTCPDLEGGRSGAEQSACEALLDSYKIPEANFVPAPAPSFKNAIQSSSIWQDKYVAVAVRSGQGTVGREGLYIFDINTFDLVYYYPGSNPANSVHGIGDYRYPPDKTIRLITGTQYTKEGRNGDLYVFGYGGQVYRLGKNDHGLYRGY